MIRSKLIFFALAALMVLPVSALRAQEDTTSKQLHVLTSFLPIQAHTSAIAGDAAKVEQLLNQETGPHDFQLSPSAVRRLADADLLIINGAGIEDWMDELIKRAGNKNLVVVDTSKGIKLLPSPDVIAEGSKDSLRHWHGHAHDDGMNPHTWLDPVIASQQAQTILAALRKADPANAELYAANAAAYMEKLSALDADFRSTLIPLPNKNLVTFHDAFPYLADRYQLRYVGSISEFPEKDPTPKALANLVDRIKELKVGVLFAEESYAPELLLKIAAQTGARVSQLDTLEVGEGAPTAYLDRMRSNLKALQDAFKPTGPE